MRFQVTVDTLFTSAALLAVAVLLLTSFYSLYKISEQGIRKGHLKYLARVIEDRVKTCDIIDGVKIYAPYEVNLLCSQGKICWRDLCVNVKCSGGGTGKIFTVKGCRVLPVN